MATFNFELVSPQNVAFSGPVDQVDVPGSEGDFGVLAGHAPLIALLRPGVLTVYAGGEQTKIVVLGGFAEVNPQGMTVLADFAAPVADVDRDLLAGQIKDLEEDVADASDGPARDRAAQRLDQLKAVQAALGP
jgi:F-type H+-transporting ATPase subunit epsilon